MSYHLTVMQPFGNYQRGAHITDAAEVAAVLAGPNSGNVNKRIPHADHASGAFYKSDADLKPKPTGYAKSLLTSASVSPSAPSKL